MLGNALAYAPNVSVAFLSAARLLNIIDRIPQYRNVSSIPGEQSMVKKSSCQNGLLLHNN